MTICYFGIYDPAYNRNKVFIKGLRSNGAEVIECNSRRNGLAKYFELVKKFRQIRNKFDCLVVGFPGYQAMILARLLTRRPIIFDAFFSIYDAMVLDRKIIKPYSPRAWYFWLLDWTSCRLANKILLDTREHTEYFSSAFHLSPAKLAYIFIGADTDIFIPRQQIKKTNDFIVHFHGSFIPLQGVEYIIEAADILKKEKDIVFNLIGQGQEFNKIANQVRKLKLADKVKLRGYVSQAELLDYVAEADICLGIFGNTARTKRIIPNKLFECVAMKKPLLTADTAATREIFSEEQVMFCQTSNGTDLAQKIIELKNNPSLREELAAQGYLLFKEKLQPNSLAQSLLKIILELTNKK